MCTAVLDRLGRTGLGTLSARLIRQGAALGLAWSTIALLFAAQGNAVSLYRGSPQPWWPSLGYTLAIFSIWALLTVPIVMATRWVRVRGVARPSSWFVIAGGLPVVAALHVGLFALLYWPAYNGDGAVPSRRAMAERMAIPNLPTNTLLYVLIVGGALVRPARSDPARPEGAQARDPAVSTLAPPVVFKVKTRGRLRLISPDAVHWIRAAGDYAELHAGSQTHLIEASLASLEKTLPAGAFARVHRSALVRPSAVFEVQSAGRGDAMLTLVDGTQLRLSRRYRANLAGLLQSSGAADPARRAGRSHSPQ